MSYFLELRRRLIWFCGCYAVLFVFFFYWQNQLLKWLLTPVSHVLEKSSFVVATHIASPVLAPLHVASQAAFYCSLPLLWFQFWRFVRPALHLNEQRWMKWGGLISFVLGLSGVMFCFYGVLPFMFELFSRMTPSDVHYFPELSLAVTFVLEMLVLFGLAFQLPLLMLILVRVTPLTYSFFKAIRPYVIVIAFIVGMLLTPPDVMSQILLAVPLCLLYELGMLIIKKSAI